jgi:general secretion pathway protein I
MQIPRYKSSRGFSLLEVLVAFVILALVLGTLMEIFSGGLRNVGRAGEYQRAVLLAQSKLAAVGIETPLIEGESDGEFDPTYRWHIGIKPFQASQMEPVESTGPAMPGLPAPTPAPAAAPVPVALMPVTLLEVEIRVLWGAGDQSSTVSLNTVRLANKVVF